MGHEGELVCHWLCCRWNR